MNKAIYGLKQAPQAWHLALSNWLFSIGFRRCDAEPCVFWRKGTFLYIHVDDIAIFSKNPNEFKNEVKNRFKIKDLGEAKLLLGMKIEKETNATTLSQSHYIDKLLELFDCSDIHPARTPLNPKEKLTNASVQEVEEFKALNRNFRAIVGALNFLSCTTRADITFAVSTLSQFLQRPGIKHWNAAIQVLQYLKYTKQFKLYIKKSNCLSDLVAYADADWANCPVSSRSISGNLVIWNGSVISWRSKKQPTPSLSTTEAEYKSIGDITKELMWIKVLLKKIFNIKLVTPTRIFEDNQGAIDLAKNEINASGFKTKHMALKFHFIRREIKLKNIELIYVKSANMLADFLTKPLGGAQMSRARRLLDSVCSFPVSQ